jgi:hypothetical protein
MLIIPSSWGFLTGPVRHQKARRFYILLENIFFKDFFYLFCYFFYFLVILNFFKKFGNLEFFKFFIFFEYLSLKINN